MKAFTAIGFALLLISATTASATMPLLTPKPTPATPDACRAWASEQDEDTIYMWGTQEDGTNSPEVAVERLTRSCMGHPTPEIVGFGSSVGFDEAYCKKHGDQKICAGRRP